jgi:hypothetical protein
MGMPGSETALEELLCRVLGDLLEEGVIAKIADDLYCGGDTPPELLINWRKVLYALHTNGLNLSAPKTVIAPKSTTILGWIWSQGSIHASSHRIATLATCPLPDTVRAMRSYIGAYKVLARVLPHASTLIAPLDNAISGKESRDRITWSDKLKTAFLQSQEKLMSNETIILPSDQLWIVTDGAVKCPGLGATLYVIRDEKPCLAGFFSAKLRKNQVTWIPCEIEALSIDAAIKHFSPLITQSEHKCCILTDSKPCVQAYEKLCRGEFSSSARVSTFLSTVSRYQISLRHLAGSANLPSDFASRNAPECETPNCKICSFISRSQDSVIREVSVQDVVSGLVKVPFTSRAAWSTTQSECPDLRRVRAQLEQGTRPSKKATKIRDVKRYLNVATIARDGLLVVRRDEPLSPRRECIIVPRPVLEGLLTALHLKLVHPTCHQLKTIVRRYFYALDMDKTVEQVSRACHQCAALKKAPHNLAPQTTGDAPDSIGVTFAADVLKRERQLVLVLRETVTSYTSCCIIESEKHHALRDALVRLCVEMRPLDGPFAVIRTDPAPGFKALVTDEFLQSNRLCIEIGREKNLNKNPVADKAIQELEDELLRQEPSGGPVSDLTLAIAVARLNTRIRGRGLSSREMWTQRDQFTNDQVPVTDQDLFQKQHSDRVSNHPHSEKSKTPCGKLLIPTLQIGYIVYLCADRNKTCARDRYLVVQVDGEWCNVRKFKGRQLRCMSYHVRLSECYKVPVDCSITSPQVRHQEEDSHEDSLDLGLEGNDTILKEQRCPDLPDIPLEISMPYHSRRGRIK